MLVGLMGIGCSEQPAPVRVSTPEAVEERPISAIGYQPVREPLEGEPRPAIVQAVGWFFIEEGKPPKPAPARFDIYRKEDTGWRRFRVEDADSDVFHKVAPYDGGLLTAGGRRAMLKKWTFADGAWSATTLWEGNWGGKHPRVREFEVGDVDGDGEDEIVVATHGHGVVAVLEPGQGERSGLKVTELHRTPNTFIHEIEIGDVDGDGQQEFYATPSAQNTPDHTQAGMIVAYRFNGTAYEQRVIEDARNTHVKEILAADLDRDGRSELFGVLEAVLRDGKVQQPIRVRQYDVRDARYVGRDILTIDDLQSRFVVPADVDGDGFRELVISTRNALWLADSEDRGGRWTKTRIAGDSGGFEHAVMAADLDEDGQLELYVASDDQGEFRVYHFDRVTRAWRSEVIAPLDLSAMVWNMAATRL